MREEEGQGRATGQGAVSRTASQVVKVMKEEVQEGMTTGRALAQTVRSNEVKEEQLEERTEATRRVAEL